MPDTVTRVCQSLFAFFSGYPSFYIIITHEPKPDGCQVAKPRQLQKVNCIMEYTGSSYTGDVKNGRFVVSPAGLFQHICRMEGSGEYSFADGSRYVGEMLDGQ